MRRYIRKSGVEAAIVTAFQGAPARRPKTWTGSTPTHHPQQLPGHVARRIKELLPRLAADPYDKCLVIEACKSHASWMALQGFRRGQIFRQMLEEIQRNENPGTRIRLERAIRRADTWTAERLKQTEEGARQTLVARHQDDNIDAVKRNLDDIVRKARELRSIALAGVHLLEQTQARLERRRA